MPERVRVLIVDDSALVRKILSDLLSQNPAIEVVGTAQDGSFVLQKIPTLNPDVITLDVEMRTKGGLEVLPEIVQKFHLPVIMVSAHTERGAYATVKALELGAVDFVTKPHAFGSASMEEIGELLTQKILAVARSKGKVYPRKSFAPINKPAGVERAAGKPVAPPPLPVFRTSHYELIAIGASTGGTEAIKDVLVDLPVNLPGIVIVQHMPPGFTKAFSDRLNTLCRIEVKEATDGDYVQPGTALIAPGSHHMEVHRAGAHMRVKLLETPPVNRHRPSVDVLFHSVAQHVGGKTMGVILTGMGGDGSVGLKAMRDLGSLTIAQDEDSCVVFGMPKEAIKLGGAVHILPLGRIAPFLISSVIPSRFAANNESTN
ncbi:MAG: chemotaxis response regulator protein-glutamate methylesterase [Candidatus Omnitrophota bacterium]